jgi:hypothetical protein
MKRLSPVFLLLFLLLEVSHAQEDSLRRFFHLGLFSPISTNGKKASEYTSNFSLHLLWGRSKNSYGFSSAGLVNIAENNAYGLQIAGLVNRAGKPESGSYWDFDFNHYSGGTGKGLSIAGLMNLYSNYEGVLIAAGNNVNTLSGIQIGLLNGVQQKVSGAQLGFMNGAFTLSGVQIGMGNIAKNGKGVQIGIFNDRGTASAFQIGIINEAKSNKYPIGLINLIEDGHKKAGVGIDETGSIIAEFRSGSCLYGIVGMGYNFISGKHMVIEGGIGTRLYQLNKFSIDTELIGSLYSIPDMRMQDDKDKSDHQFKAATKFSWRLLPAYKLSDKLELFAGPSINYMYTHQKTNKKMLPSWHWWNKYTDKSFKQIHIGGIIGIQRTF